MIGKTISHYRMLEKLGEGGMGVVWKAEDLNLKRVVALKFLHASDDLPRLLREAQVAASLNHSNICTVYEVDTANGFLAMELVEGESLAGKIGGRPLPVEEAIGLATQIGEGLKAAHEKGIIHRDIKSGNILVTGQGQVKVLDFGLAHVAGQAGLTREGATAGTPGYMAPEQMRGEAVDRRTDIWALGAVLHEMLMGRLPIGTVGALPQGLDRVVAKALAADPKERYQHVADLLVDLRRWQAPPVRRSRRWLWAAAALTVVLAALGSYLFWRRGEGPSWRNATFTQLTDQAGPELSPSLSPDGKSFVYASRASGNWDIYLQRVGGKNPINLTKDSPADDTEPAFSPNGEMIAFRSERDGGGIFVMGATGESVKRLTDSGYNPAWSPNGREIVFGTMGFARPDYRTGYGSQLVAVDVATGNRRVISTRGKDAVQPSWSPHGRRIAFWGARGTQRDIWTVSAEGGEPAPVTADAPMDWSPAWSPDGKHLYFSSERGGSMNLWRVPIDESSGALLGRPEPVTTPSPYSGNISLSQDGRRIAYVEQVSTTNIYRARFDPIKEEVIGQPLPLTQGSRDVWLPDVSPDGRWLAFGSTGKRENLFVMGTDGTGLRQLTDDVYRDRAPVWSPDGTRIAFMSNRQSSGSYNEIWSINSDGSGLQQLTYTSSMVSSVPVWSPDGTRLAYPTADYDAFIIEVGKPRQERSPQRLPKMDEAHARFMVRSWSPDGRKLAGERRADDGSPAGIVIYPFESEKFERVTDFGWYPQWLSDSRRLLFHSEGKIYLVDSRSRRTREVLSVAPREVAPYRFAVSRDNVWLCFGVIATEADIWLAALN